MTDKFSIFCRASGVWYLEEKEIKHQESLRIRDKGEAKRLLEASNEAQHQPAINIQIARVYLATGDPKLVSRTWQEVMKGLVALKRETNGHAANLRPLVRIDTLTANPILATNRGSVF